MSMSEDGKESMTLSSVRYHIEIYAAISRHDMHKLTPGNTYTWTGEQLINRRTGYMTGEQIYFTLKQVIFTCLAVSKNMQGWDCTGYMMLFTKQLFERQ